MNYLLRRRKLGRTSVREIVRLSTTGLQAFRSDHPAIPDGNIVFRWGCTANVEAETIINKAEAIHRVSDKAGFRRVLNEHELCPPTFFRQFDDDGWMEGEMLFAASGERPIIIRPQTHHQGRALYFCTNQTQVLEAIGRCGPGWYASDYIEKEAEYRVFVVQGRAVCVARKYPGEDSPIAWNVARGGRFVNVRWDDWPLKAVRISIEAFNLSGLDFGGVDVMTKGDEAYVLEINSAPSLTSEYRQQCMAKAFDYIVTNGHRPIPLIERRGGYKKFIHPAVCTEAQVP